MQWVGTYQFSVRNCLSFCRMQWILRTAHLSLERDLSQPPINLASGIAYHFAVCGESAPINLASGIAYHFAVCGESAPINLASGIAYHFAVFLAYHFAVLRILSGWIPYTPVLTSAYQNRWTDAYGSKAILSNQGGFYCDCSRQTAYESPKAKTPAHRPKFA